MKSIATICVYGDFKNKDFRIKVFTGNGTQRFTFQNILHEAGYDAELFSLHDTDLEDSVTDEPPVESYGGYTYRKKG